MEFEAIMNRLEFVGKFVGFRCKFSGNSRKYLEILWLIFVIFCLLLIASVLIHYLIEIETGIEQGAITLSQASNILNVVVRLLIFLYQRKSLRKLVEELKLLTRKGKELKILNLWSKFPQFQREKSIQA